MTKKNAGKQEIPLHLSHSLDADGHKDRALKWIFEDSTNERNDKEKRVFLFIPECSRTLSTAGCGPCGRPHAKGKQEISSHHFDSLDAGKQEIPLHLPHSLDADGHKGRALQWIFEDSANERNDKEDTGKAEKRLRQQFSMLLLREFGQKE